MRDDIPRGLQTQEATKRRCSVALLLCLIAIVAWSYWLLTQYDPAEADELADWLVYFPLAAGLVFVSAWRILRMANREF